jgi:hypothetical protein
MPGILRYYPKEKEESMQKKETDPGTVDSEQAPPAPVSRRVVDDCCGMLIFEGEEPAQSTGVKVVDNDGFYAGY